MTMTGKRILVIEDDPQFSFIVKSLLEREGLRPEVMHKASDVLARFAPNEFDAVLLDLFLSGESGLEVLRHLKQREPELPVIIMTANASMDTVAEALRHDAFDYVTKPFEVRAILEILAQALARRREASSAASEAEQLVSFPSIVGRSPAMIELFKAITRVSQTDSTVLISGESGTGKELVARAIHDHSPRKGKPFIAVNCGALTETLLESELFGHTRGAFTGAHASRSGFFESATGGTIFLDEISETTPVFQVRLLRVLQERTIRPVGSSQERPVNVRVIAATNRLVESLLTSSDFRRDLLYRLSVIHVHIPALRERREDVPLLLSYFVYKFNQRQNKSVRLPEETTQWVQTRSWPGNVRELENAVERAVTMNVSGRLMPEDFLHFGLAPSTEEPAHLPEVSNLVSRIVESREGIEEPAPRPALELPVAAKGPPGSLDDMTREHILDVLKHTQGNKLRAAEVLGIGRYSLYRMAKRLNVDLDHWSDEARPMRKRAPRTAGAEIDEELIQDEVFDHLDDITYTRDLAGLITSINTAGEQFFGYSRGQIIGRSLHELIDPAMEVSLNATNEKLLASAHDRSEVVTHDRDGRIRVLESSTSLVRDANGRPVGARGIMRDITESKELEARLRTQARELEEANEKLKELNRIKADFTAMLVHDLKTPISTMMMALQLLQDILPEESDVEIRKMIAGGLASGRSMVQIVEDMLELFRFDSTPVPLVSSRLQVEEVIQDPFNEALVQARLKDIQLIRNVEPNLPDIFADKAKICRVVSNLLSNALNFTPPLGTVRIEAQKSESQKWVPWMRKGDSIHIEGLAASEAAGERGRAFVQISVCDTGEGIPPENLSYIFDPYWQSKRKGLGTGLGLAVVKRIVAAHGGFLVVRSRVGVGSEFYFTLPTAAEGAVFAKPDEPQKKISAGRAL
jgi:PAS domain S-box-containing protein